MMKRLTMAAALAAAMTVGAVEARAEGASWLRTNTASAMNPKISVIGDMVGQTGTAGQTEDGFHFRELEIGIQTEVDPYARADIFIGGMNDAGGTPEMEEAYVTLLALPLGIQARGGRFKLQFGKLNMVHPHEFPQVDQPIVLGQFFGESGLVGTGVEMSRIFAPFGLFTEVSYGLLQDLGGHSHGDHEDAPTTTITDDFGNPVEVAVAHTHAEPAQRLRNFAHVAKARFYKDLTDQTNVEVGLSGALHEPQESLAGGHVTDYDRKRYGVMDLTVRWKPLAAGNYRSAIWRTEAAYADLDLAAEHSPVDGSTVEPAKRFSRRGGYSYLELQPAKRWRIGARADYAEDPTIRAYKDTPFITRALSPYVTFTLSEFNRFRAQYQRRDNPDGTKENLGFFQWTVVMGPHGAHPF